MFTEKFIASFTFLWRIWELWTHYTSDFFNHFSLELILNFIHLYIKLWNWFWTHYLLNSLVWYNKIMKFYLIYWNIIRLSYMFKDLRFLNYLRNMGSWSKSCIWSIWNFFYLWISYNWNWPLSIYLWSLRWSKSWCLSVVDILMLMLGSQLL